MKANIATLVVLLCAIAVAMSIGRSQVGDPAPRKPAEFQLKVMDLVLSTKPILVSPEGEVIFAEGDTFSVSLENMDDRGAEGMQSFRSNGVVIGENVVSLNLPEWKTLTNDLSLLKGWRTIECDDGAPEAEVLYTLLKLQTSEGKFSSSWRGLPEEQRLVADKLMSSPLGPTLSAGMARLSTAKAKSK